MPTAPTVLLVDDDDRLLASLRRTLHHEPYELLFAETADAALWLLESRTIDVLVTDERMPGLCGADFLARVRREHPAVVSIMLTGHADLATAMRAINAGEVYRFFTKPCDAAALALAIRQALQLKSLIRQARRLLATVQREFAEVEADGERPPAAFAAASLDAPAYDGDDAFAQPRVFEVDDSPTDLDVLLREIERGLEEAERRRIGRRAGRPTLG